jgi:hypothetical protein
MMTANATTAHCSEPRRGDVTQLRAGCDVAPPGLDSEGEFDAALQLPGLAPVPGLAPSLLPISL